MFNGCLGACIRSVISGKGGKEGSDDCDELAAVADVFGTGLENKECALGVDAIKQPC